MSSDQQHVSGSPIPLGREFVEAALSAGLPALDEQAGKQFFRAYGIAVPEGETPAEQPSAAA